MTMQKNQKKNTNSFGVYSIILACVAVLVCGMNADADDEMAQSKRRGTVEYSTPEVVPTTGSMARMFGNNLEEHPYTKRQCKTIPDSMRLCKGVPYQKMFMPNLLGHERMGELLRQSNTWTPLLSTNCHPQLQQFLCSLYAPVCISDQPGTFPPCRSLCESVRDSCSPVMKKFGFVWPRMLRCDNFPQKSEQNSLCMSVEARKGVEMHTCAPCRKKMSKTSLKKKICQFDFVMKMRVKSLSYREDSFKIKLKRKSRVLYKWFDEISPSFKSGKDTRRITLHMQHATNCTCDVVNTKKTPYLVTGWKQGNKLMIHYITKWEKRTTRIVRVLKKKKCMRSYLRNNRNAVRS